MEPLAYSRSFAGTVDQAIDRLGAELKQRGFGVLGTVRVHEILKEKLGATVDPLVLLDVCSPVHADRALSVSREVALLLPCKVVVSREGGSTQLSLQRPTVLLRAFFPNPALEPLGAEVERALRDAIEAVAASSPSSGP